MPNAFETTLSNDVSGNPFPNMASGPPMHAGTQECQKEAHTVLSKEVDKALFTLVKTLDDLAVKHKQCVYIFQTFGMAQLMY
jgi:hypothetical protein